MWSEKLPQDNSLYLPNRRNFLVEDIMQNLYYTLRHSDHQQSNINRYMKRQENVTI